MGSLININFEEMTPYIFIFKKKQNEVKKNNKKPETLWCLDFISLQTYN